MPEILDTSVIDEAVSVTIEDAMANARRLAMEEGLLVGISSGANLAACLKVHISYLIYLFTLYLMFLLWLTGNRKTQLENITNLHLKKERKILLAFFVFLLLISSLVFSKPSDTNLYLSCGERRE